MVQKVSKIWFEGEFIPWDEARVHLLTHSLHYGLGAFEGIRAYRRADGRTSIFRLDAHIQRLLDTCRLCLIEPRFRSEEIQQACVELLRQNDMTEAYLRPLVFIAEGAMGIYVPNNPIHTAIVAWKWGAYLGDDALRLGIRAKISSWQRHHVNVSLAKGKIMGQYTNSVLAKREAKLGGYDEAILLDTQGYVSEGSGENLFVVKRGCLITPPLSGSILAGITRETILTLAREEGIPVREERITRDELYLSDEAFFTGTAAEVTPIREVDNRAIGAGKPGPVTLQLQQRYFDIVREADDSHPEWHTFLHALASPWPSRACPAPRRHRPPRCPPAPLGPPRSPRPLPLALAGKSAPGAASTPGGSPSRWGCPMARPGASTTTVPPGCWRPTRPPARPSGSGSFSKTTRSTPPAARSTLAAIALRSRSPPAGA
jgi:branched-chain amino acid aminotransferase